MKEATTMAMDTTGGHPDMDYDAHRATYKGFIRGTIVVATLVAVLLVGMLFFLV